METEIEPEDPDVAGGGVVVAGFLYLPGLA